MMASFIGVPFFFLLLLSSNSNAFSMNGNYYRRSRGVGMTMGLHDFSLKSLNGEIVALSKYRGRVVLVEVSLPLC